MTESSIPIGALRRVLGVVGPSAPAAGVLAYLVDPRQHGALAPALRRRIDVVLAPVGELAPYGREDDGEPRAPWGWKLVDGRRVPRCKPGRKSTAEHAGQVAIAVAEERRRRPRRREGE